MMLYYFMSQKINFHLFMYSRKWSPVRLLRIKKLLKSIDFHLAKHVLKFNTNHRWNLFEKFQILKLR